MFLFLPIYLFRFLFLQENQDLADRTSLLMDHVDDIKVNSHPRMLFNIILFNISPPIIWHQTFSFFFQFLFMFTFLNVRPLNRFSFLLFVKHASCTEGSAYSPSNLLYMFMNFLTYCTYLGIS